MLSGIRSFLNQFKSSQNIRQQGAALTARAIGDTINGVITGDVLAERRMQENLEQVNRYRDMQLHQYNQATAWTSANAQRLGGNSRSAYGLAGSILNEYSNIDPTAAFIGNAIAGKLAYDTGDFNSENKALKIQRAMDLAVQEKFMKQTVKSGNQALEGINKQSQILGGQLTDQAVQNTDNYYAQESFIQDNGIEGSSNMSRNLEYGKQRDRAAVQMQYDMIGEQAQGVQRNMAESFDQLVQSQEQATLQTLIAPVQFDTAGAMQASRNFFMNQPAAQDIDMAIAGALPQQQFSVPCVQFGSGSLIPGLSLPGRKPQASVPEHK